LSCNRCRIGPPVGSDRVGNISEQDIRENVTSHAEKRVIPRVAIPKKFAFAIELPLTSVDKIDKKKLRLLLSWRQAIARGLLKTWRRCVIRAPSLYALRNGTI